jgi:hypothetical protein
VDAAKMNEVLNAVNEIKENRLNVTQDRNIEEKINNVLVEFNGKYEIVDIKYADISCMIIYKKA